MNGYKHFDKVENGVDSCSDMRKEVLFFLEEIM